MAELNIEVRAQVDDAIRGLGHVNKSFDLLGKANQDAAGALGVFGISLTNLANPITAVATFTKAAIDKTLQWGDTIDELTRITGESAAESSRMAIVLGDWGVSTDSLKAASRALKEEGLAPTLETLKALAVEYQTLPEGAARTEWGTKKLGRAYFELSEVLTKTPAEFDAMSAAAERSGRMMDEAGVQKAEQFAIQMQVLRDKVDGLSLALGQVLIPILSEAAMSLELLTTGNQQVAEAADKHTAEVFRTSASYEEYHAELLRVNELVGRVIPITDEFGNVQGYVTDQTNILTEAAWASARANVGVEETLRANLIAHTDLTGGIVTETAALDADTAAANALKAAQELSTGVYALATTAIGQANIGLAQQVDLQEQLALASGRVTAEELAQKDAVGFLTVQLSAGKITMGEYLDSINALASGASTAAGIIDSVGASINGLPTSHTIDINVVTHGAAGEAGLEDWSPPAGTTTSVPTGTEENPINGRFQHGGSFIVPGSGGLDSQQVRFWATPGEQVSVTPPGQVVNSGGNTNNYYGVQADTQAAYTRALAGAF